MNIIGVSRILSKVVIKLVFKFESHDRSLLAKHTTDRRRSLARWGLGRRQRTRWALNCEKRMDRYYIARPNVIPGSGSLDGRADGLIDLGADLGMERIRVALWRSAAAQPQNES